MEHDSNSKARSYIFTLNNWTPEEFEKIKVIKYKYIIIGNETGAKTGTPHLQGYIHFKSPISHKSICKQMPRAFLKAAKGTADDNFVYCSKQQILFEDGEKPQMGKRNDITTIKDIIKEGGGMKEVIETATSLQSIRTAEVLLKYVEKPRDFKPQVKWYYGKTGTGKTRAAVEELENAYITMENLKWWEGYDAHENVIIDDFRRDSIQFSSLLRLLDRYAFRVETKGASRQLLAKNIIITCPEHPESLFENTREDIKQLLRRIDEIKEFK